MAASDSIYGAEVDGEVAIRVSDFPMDGALYDDGGGARRGRGRADGARRPRRSWREGADRGRLPPLRRSGALRHRPHRHQRARRDDARHHRGERHAAREERRRARGFLHRGQGRAGDRGRGAAHHAHRPKAPRSTRRRRSSTRWSRISPSISAPARCCGSASRPIRTRGSIRPVRVSLYEDDRHIATVALSDTGSYVAARRAGARRGAARGGSQGADAGAADRRASDRLCRHVGHGAVARHAGAADREPRPHLRLRRRLPEPARPGRRARGHLFGGERGRRRGGRGDPLRGAHPRRHDAPLLPLPLGRGRLGRLLRRRGQERAAFSDAQAHRAGPLLLILRHAAASDPAPLPPALRRRLGGPLRHADHGGRQRQRSRRSARAPATAARSR